MNVIVSGHLDQDEESAEEFFQRVSASSEFYRWFGLFISQINTL